MENSGLRIEDFRALPTDAERREKAATLLGRIEAGDQEALRAYLSISMRLFHEASFRHREGSESRRHRSTRMSKDMRKLVESDQRLVLMAYLKQVRAMRDRVKVLFFEPRVHSPLAAAAALAGWDNWTTVTVLDSHGLTAQAHKLLMNEFGLGSRVSIRKSRNPRDPLSNIRFDEHGSFDGFITQHIMPGHPLNFEFMKNCVRLQPALDPDNVVSVPGDLEVKCLIGEREYDLTTVNLSRFESPDFKGSFEAFDLTPNDFPLIVKYVLVVRGPDGDLMNFGHNSARTTPHFIGPQVHNHDFFKASGPGAVVRRWLKTDRDLPSINGIVTVDTGKPNSVKFERTGRAAF